MFTLRPDQLALTNQATNAIARGSVPCVVAPTGAGKTVILSELTRRALADNQRVVAVCHRQEICHQLFRSIRHHNPDAVIGVMAAGTKPQLDGCNVLIGMVPTMVRRLSQLAALHGCTLLQDEMHHAGAKSWRDVVAALAPTHRAGLSATPITPTGRGLGDTDAGITELVIGPQTRQLIDQGHLAPFRYYATQRLIDSSAFHRQRGDFLPAEIAVAADAIAGDVIPEWQRLNPDHLPTITVCTSLDHARALEADFNAAGIKARSVFGSTPAATRSQIFDDFRTKRITVLLAVAIIDEGLDIPHATVLQLTRPTASLRLYRQLCGRVLRTAPNKDHAIIIDHTDNFQRLGLPDEDIDWQLHRPARLKRDINPKEDERKEQKKKERQKIAAELRLINRTLIQPTPQLLAKLIHEQAHDAHLIKRFEPCAVLLDRQALRVMAESLSKPSGWVEQQLWGATMNPQLQDKARRALVKLAA